MWERTMFITFKSTDFYVYREEIFKRNKNIFKCEHN